MSRMLQHDDKMMSVINNNVYPSWDLLTTPGTPIFNYGQYNSGDTAWMLAATALVLLMTMPGLAIYYSGMVRDKNVLACKFHTSCLITSKIIVNVMYHVMIAYEE